MLVTTEAQGNLTYRRLNTGDTTFFHTMINRASVNPAVDAWPSQQGSLVRMKDGYSAPWGRPHDRGFVALDQGEPIGAAWMRLTGQWFAMAAQLGSSVPEVGIAVKDAHHGRGIAGNLLDATLMDAGHAGVELAFLKVFKTNPIACRLYDRQGFKTVGHYTDPQDARYNMAIMAINPVAYAERGGILVGSSDVDSPTTELRECGDNRRYG